MDEDEEVLRRRAQQLVFGVEEPEIMIRGTLINMAPWREIVLCSVAKAGAASL